jgi:pimeloyl-ACP methyl ester carboxylesterase
MTNRNLIFLPGAGGDPEFWRALGDRLPAAWKKTYLGWPGLGNQPASATINGIDDLVTMVESHLGEEPVDLIAQSMGGAIAVRVALKQRTKVRRLVLAATSVGIDVTSFGAKDWRAAYRQEYPNAAAWVLGALPDLSNEFSPVKQPTLLLWGDADRISPVAVGRKLWQLLPTSTLCIVPGGDHSFAHDQAADLVTMISNHLE